MTLGTMTSGISTRSAGIIQTAGVAALGMGALADNPITSAIGVNVGMTLLALPKLVSAVSSIARDMRHSRPSLLGLKRQNSDLVYGVGMAALIGMAGSAGLSPLLLVGGGVMAGTLLLSAMAQNLQATRVFSR